LIDLHCHILPGIDDGPSQMEESLTMADIARSDGIRSILATPHTLNNVFFNPFSRVIENVNILRELLSEKKIDIDLYPGADVHICAGMVERVRKREAGTINDNQRYILIEFPHQILPPGYREELFNLKLNNITPIITHPERHLVLQRRLELLTDLVSMGCLVQITGMSVTGEFGEEAMICAHQLLKRRLAHVVATDAHSASSRPPTLSRAVEVATDILGTYREAEDLVKDRPQAILEGHSVEIPEPKEPGKKHWWQVFGG
jgi:protein-tyrosine phosphatase